MQTRIATRPKRERINSTPLQSYLNEINETNLLTPEEERHLAFEISMGNPEAREHMVKANLRLVVNIARSYLGKGLSLDDLIEEGNLGLLRAVEGFDASMQTRFSTYASYWIKQSMRRAVINQGRAIRLPAYMVNLLSKWRRATTELTEQLGRTPTPDEVGRELKLSKKKLNIVKKALEANNLTPHADSLGDDVPGIDDYLTDERHKGPDETLIEADDLERTLTQIENLDDRERTVLRMRFGLDPYLPMTLREVGEQLQLTRERVRQLESNALGKLAVGLGSDRRRRRRF